MEKWLRPAALLLRDFGFLLHGGSMMAFAALLLAQPRVAGLPLEAVLRSYRAWGPGLGLSLGAAVFGALVDWHYRTGLDWSPARIGWSGTLLWSLFFTLWVSNIRLEVWTLEAARRADPPGGPLDATALAAAARPLRAHLVFQALLIVPIFVLERLTCLC